MVNIRFYFLLIISVLNMGIIKAQATAGKCRSIYDVLQSKEINSYIVTKKKYFYENCINKEGLCIKNPENPDAVEKGDIVLSGRIEIDGVMSNHWCTAYLSSSSLRGYFGWFLEIDGLQPLGKEQYDDIIGYWRAVVEEDGFSKYFYISSYNDRSISIGGQSVSPYAQKYGIGPWGAGQHMLEGDVFKIAKNRYIIIGYEENISQIIRIDDKIFFDAVSSSGGRNGYDNFSGFYRKEEDD